MNSVAKIVVGILAAIGALYVGTMIFATFFIDVCDTNRLVKLDSPDRERTAFIELRSCPDKPDAKLSVYISQTDNLHVRHGAALATNPATTEIYLEWRGERALVVRHPAALKIDNRPSSLAGVDIRFESMER